jgi:hypothetical protein
MTLVRWSGAVAVGALFGCSSATAPPASSTPSEPPPSFKDDVLPLVYQSCALTACHASKQADNGFYVTYDAAAVYAAMFKESARAPGMKIVAPGNPKSSFLMYKLDGTQGELSSRCPAGCGAVMPQDEPLDSAKRDVFRRWIAAGAKND